jgi:hypothetical protein
MRHESEDPAQAVAEHMAECMGPGPALVVDGNGDEVVAGLVAAGWVLEDRVDVVAGKRIRLMHPPPGVTIRAVEEKQG